MRFGYNLYPLLHADSRTSLKVDERSDEFFRSSYFHRRKNLINHNINTVRAMNSEYQKFINVIIVTQILVVQSSEALNESFHICVNCQVGNFTGEMDWLGKWF